MPSSRRGRARELIDLRVLERPHIAVLVVVLVVGFVLAFRLGSMPLFEADEARYGEVAREMLETGDWVTPRVNYVPYLANPPLMFWLVALSFSALEPGEFAARVPAALSALAGLLVCLAFGRAAFGARAGLLASLVLATSGLYFALALLLRFDMLLTLFITLALFCWWRARREEVRRRQTALYLLSYAAAGLATLSKGPIGAILPGLVIAAYLAWWGRLGELRDVRLLVGLAVFLAVAAPWFVLAEARNPGCLRHFLVEERIARYLAARPYGAAPLYFFVPVLIVGFFPWTAFLPLAVAEGWRRAWGINGRRRRRRGQRRARENAAWLQRARLAWRQRPQQPSPEADAAALCLIWFAVAFLLFSASRAKLYADILPAWPPLALLVGLSLAQATRERHTVALSSAWRLSFGGFLATLAVVAAGALYYERTYRPVPQRLVEPYEAAVAVAAVLGILLILVALLRRMRATAVVLMVAGTAGLLLALTGLMLPLAFAGSPKRLVRRIEPVIRQQDRVICCLHFVYTAPFYLKRPIPYLGPQPPPEFAFDSGEAKQKGVWMDDGALDAFLDDSRHPGRRVFGFTEARVMPSLQHKYGEAVEAVDKAERTVLFANAAGAAALRKHGASLEAAR